MAAIQEPNIGIHYGWDLGESGWNVQMNANLQSLGLLSIIGVKSAVTTSPPASPENGDRYLIPTSAGGAWVTHDNKIAVWDEPTTTWLLFTPSTTWVITALDDGQTYLYNGSAWVLKGSLLGEYADDTAAATGGVEIGGEYVNSSTGALTIRRT